MAGDELWGIGVGVGVSFLDDYRFRREITFLEYE